MESTPGRLLFRLRMCRARFESGQRVLLLTVSQDGPHYAARAYYATVPALGERCYLDPEGDGTGTLALGTVAAHDPRTRTLVVHLTDFPGVSSLQPYRV